MFWNRTVKGELGSHDSQFTFTPIEDTRSCKRKASTKRPGDHCGCALAKFTYVSLALALLLTSPLTSHNLYPATLNHLTLFNRAVSALLLGRHHVSTYLPQR
jgi:hypothetical protein